MDVDAPDDNDDDRMLMTDAGGDTENEDEHEAVTPHSSQGSLDVRGGARRRPAAASMVYEGQKNIMEIVVGAKGARVQNRDNEDMEAAYALCGLARI